MTGFVPAQITAAIARFVTCCGRGAESPDRVVEIAAKVVIKFVIASFIY